MEFSIHLLEDERASEAFNFSEVVSWVSFALIWADIQDLETQTGLMILASL
jgi:hypothetical protein